MTSHALLGHFEVPCLDGSEDPVVLLMYFLIVFFFFLIFVRQDGQLDPVFFCCFYKPGIVAVLENDIVELI